MTYMTDKYIRYRERFICLCNYRSICIHPALISSSPFYWVLTKCTYKHSRSSNNIVLFNTISS